VTGGHSPTHHRCFSLSHYRSGISTGLENAHAPGDAIACQSSEEG
jgi:hypothetical protein